MVPALLHAALAGLLLNSRAPAARTIHSFARSRPAYLAEEKVLSDFAVSGGPVIVQADIELEDVSKPVLLYLPGIELSGYSVHRQIPELSQDFEVRYLATSPDDRTGFDGLVELVTDAIEEEYNATGRSTYLCGESFGGVLALTVSARTASPPAGLGGVALINPATSVTRSWPSNLQPLLDGISSLPEGLSDAAYSAIATPIFAAISGDPLQIGGRFEDEKLPEPLRLIASVRRLAGAMPEVSALPAALPLPTLAFRLDMLKAAATEADSLVLSKLTLPVQVFASTEDRVLPSVQEARRLVRALPNAQLTQLKDSGHVPLLEVQVRLARLLRESRLTERAAQGRKDYVVDFNPPTPAEFANASASLLPIRKLTSPVWFSTNAQTGRRVSGLGALPALAGQKSAFADEDGADDPKEASSSSSPPVLFVGNHQLYGFLDLPLVVEEIYAQTGVLVRALAHPVVFSSSSSSRSNGGGANESSGAEARSGGGGGLVNYEQFGAVPVGPRTLFKLLSRGDNTLLYPGGVREAFKSTKKGEMYQLFWPPASEGGDFARVAARFGATIVPVAAIGAEEGFEMVLDADELLQLPVIGDRIAEGAKRTPAGRPGERFVSPVSVPKVPGRYYFLFGAPIDTRGVDATDREACAALYTSVQAELESSIRFLLEKRDQDPYEPVLPRAAVEASWNFTQQVPTFTL